jgi:hypothetical protein
VKTLDISNQGLTGKYVVPNGVEWVYCDDDVKKIYK